MKRWIDTDAAELVFGLFFSSIFVVLGGEHIFDDSLIQRLMPEWVPMRRAVSVLSGMVLLVGGGSIALGIYIRPAAVLLGVFLIAVTLWSMVRECSTLPVSSALARSGSGTSINGATSSRTCACGGLHAPPHPRAWKVHTRQASVG